MTILRFVLTLFVLLSPVSTLGVGAPDFLPDGPRPRIWLDAAELARLNSKQTSFDPEWTTLETWCDARLGRVVDNYGDRFDAGIARWNGYRMSGYSEYLLNFSLAYQVLKDDKPAKAATYAAYVRTLLVDGILVGFRAGEESNGLAALRVGEQYDQSVNAAEAGALGVTAASYKNGYSARNLMAVPIAYDWVYDTLSSGDRSSLEAMMFRWFDWARGVRSTYNNGVLKNGVRYHEDQAGDCTGANNCTSATGASVLSYAYGDLSNNFMGGMTSLMALIPVATYGGNGDAPAYLSAFKTLLSGTIAAQLESDLEQSGGDSPEGWNYGGGFHYLMPSLYGYYTATQDSAIAAMGWPESLGRAFIHRSGPNLLDVPIYGDWTGTPFGINRRYQGLSFFGPLQRLKPGSDISRVGQYLLKNIAYLDEPAQWVKTLWSRNDISQLVPSSQPLSSLAKGNGFFTTRSSWDVSTSAVTASLRLEGKKKAAHEGYDEGHFSVQRGNDRLLTHQNMQSTTVSYNTIVFNNTSQQALNPALLTPAIDKHIEGFNYAYVSGDITNAHKRAYRADVALLFRRSMLHLRPGIIVLYDVTRSNPTLGNLKNFYTQYGADPAMSSDTIIATVGSSKAFVKTLFPSGGTYTKTAPAIGFWRVKYTPAVQQEYDQFLHVIEATDSNKAKMTSVKTILSDDGKMIGAHIKDPKDKSANWVVLFSHDRNGLDVEGDVTYSLELPDESIYLPPSHLLVNLSPNADYTIIPPQDKLQNPQVYTVVRGVVAGKESNVVKTSSQGVLYIVPPNKPVPK